METTSKTEALVAVNKLKDKHDRLKKEILDLAIAMEEKQKELYKVEEEYASQIIVLTQ
jgi:hypothetical protein